MIPRAAAPSKEIDEAPIPARRGMFPRGGHRLTRLVKKLNVIDRPVDGADLSPHDEIDSLTIGGHGLSEIRGRWPR